VTSAAVRAANRANAARSTGPRTRAGKAAVARNALRHGLSLPVLADPALAPEVAALARRIAGEGASAARHAAAVRIAEAQVDIERVRRVRTQIHADLCGRVRGRRRYHQAADAARSLRAARAVAAQGGDQGIRCAGAPARAAAAAQSVAGRGRRRRVGRDLAEQTRFRQGT